MSDEGPNIGFLVALVVMFAGLGLVAGGFVMRADRLNKAARCRAGGFEICASADLTVPFTVIVFGALVATLAVLTMIIRW